MALRTATLVLAWVAAGAMGATGCGAPSDSIGGSEENVDTSQDLLIGDHLSGIADADFNEAKAAFAAVEDVDEGLGPVFNDAGCGNCHTQGALGGAGTAIERRFGRFANGAFNPLANEGGSLRQLKTIGAFIGSTGKECVVPLEKEPADATVRNVGRLTTPLFGLGLVDSLPDSTFSNIAQNEPQNVRGTVNTVSILLPDPSDPNQSVGSRRVGRFGWKAGVPNLVQFSADAYVNEMGITTQHCSKGTSVTAFATESAPNGVPVPAGCDDGIPGLDEGVGSCANGRTEIQEDVDEFTEFMTFLAPPPRGSTNANTIVGQVTFGVLGCGGCHTQTPYRTPSSPRNGVPGNMSFSPFSDFLLHDMGALGDQIGNSGDSLATTRMMRTAPLWGLRFRTKLLHDGRASNVTAAIQAHAGQGANAASNFNNLPNAARGPLLAFLNSL